MDKLKKLRIVSYNIHKGFSAISKRFILEEIRSALHSLEEVDIIFLQEVVGENKAHRAYIEAWPLGSQVEFLAEGKWPYYIYGSNASYEQGNHGNAIISRFPIEWGHNMNISTNPFEKRGCLHAKIRIPSFSKALDCFCVHLDLLQRGRKRQVREVLKTFGCRMTNRDPLLLAGDFNDWSQRITSTLQRQGLVEAFQFLDGFHAPTFPSRFPVLKLDRIYSRGLLPLSAEVLHSDIWKRLSDHTPLFAEFVLFEHDSTSSHTSRNITFTPADSPLHDGRRNSDSH